MRGLFTKTLYEVWPATLLFGIALLTVKALLTYILPQIQAGLAGVIDEVPFIRPVLTALLGTELGAQITSRTMQAFLWVHPIVLALVWAHEIVLCTRWPAGEVDRGTVDILLGLPVSRRTVYFCESLVWLGSGALILSMGLLGHRMAAPAMPPEMRPDVRRALLVEVNLYCVYLAVGGIALLVSALSDRRGRAMAIVFGLVLASFLLNFLAQFWPPAKQIAFLGIMHYYQPAQILQSGTLPLRDIASLLSVAALTWLVGGEVVCRRNICTV